MKTLFGKKADLGPLRWPVMTLGVFDGVHIGHQKVLRDTVAWARSMNGESIVVTFDRHPESVILHTSPFMITSLRHRLVLFEELAVDVCVVLKFDAAMANTTAEDFVQEVIHDWLKARGIIWGFDCRFGRGAKGNFQFLQELAPRFNFQVCPVEPVALDGVVVKSTHIRDAILRGDLPTARRMLGRPFSLLGTVVHGDHRGRSLGFPTANLNLHHEVSPPHGVYSCRVVLEGKPYRALTAVGIRPTFQSAASSPREVVEVHLDDFDGDLYGRDIEVRFLRSLREERRFSSVAELIEQMERDKKQVRGESLDQ
jgi:riboflavin kinase/FMN adenylyltransferase